MQTVLRTPAIVVALAALGLSGCARYRHTDPLTAYDLRHGYRFEQLAYDEDPKGQVTKNSDELFVILAFSGGGTRASALSYGVLNQLRNVTFPWKGGTRSLLDEVDVISSVSGGSFTAAYYALEKGLIFDPASPFQKRLLYYPAQRDLFAQAVYYPQNWARLRSRPEIGADLYGTTIFRKATFADLVGKQRPYVILNATDMSTGARFEFTQEQFDLLCGDLSGEPLARGVAASSAFPGLLNSMTVDKQPSPCGYTGPGSGVAPDWTINALLDDPASPRHFAATQVRGYLDPARAHLHLLDGGLADNIGARAILQSLTSTDRPVQRIGTSNDSILGGWSVLAKLNNQQVKTVLVVIVDAKTKHTTDWDTKAAGPGTGTVIGVTSGVPMSNFSRETLARIREELTRRFNGLNQPGRPAFYGAEIAFANLASANERTFFANLGTNFDLARFEVDCLADRGARLLRDAALYTAGPDLPFTDFVRDQLHGTMVAPPTPSMPDCTAESAKKGIGVRSHYLDIGVQASALISGSDDVDNKGVGPGIVFRATRPNGWGVVVDVGGQSFPLLGPVGGQVRHIGDVRLFGLLGGIARTRLIGRAEATIGVSAGVGIGRDMTIEPDTRDTYGMQGVFGVEGESSTALMVRPQTSLWYNLSNRWAATLSASYVYARPTVRVAGDDAVLYDRRINAAAVRVGAGLAFKIF